MPEHDFIFVDESGDPGYSHDESGNILSSSYYAAAALHICDDSFQYINRFMADFRYYTHMSKELKVPSGLEDYEKLLAPVKGAARRDGCFCAATAVYFDKKQYTGSYLKPRSDRPADPVRFRNYILRYLLEFHFSQTSLQAQQFDLVLDRVEMTKEQKDNLQDYISGNYHIPTPTYVTTRLINLCGAIADCSPYSYRRERRCGWGYAA